MKRKKERELVRLDLSQNLQPVTDGFKRGSLKDIEAGGVDEILFNGCLEQRDGLERITFMRALYKALKPGGKAMANIAHWSSAPAVMSPFSKWPPICAETFGFFNAQTRKDSEYEHPALKGIDFDIQIAPMFFPEWNAKSKDATQFAMKHYTNVVQGLSVTLTKRRGSRG